MIKVTDKTYAQSNTGSPGSVGIVGCGWLGKVLALNLLAKNISVFATSSKIENVVKLTQQSINAEQLLLPAEAKALVQHKVFSQQSLVIAITPQFRQGKTDYADKVAQLVAAAKQRGIVKRIILLSSTAIYDGLADVVNEDSPLKLTTSKVQLLNAAEQAVLSFSNKDTQLGIVIRLAGLVGEDRHPGKFILANKTLVNALAPVNLIHQQDAAGLIESVLNETDEVLTNLPPIFNGVSDTHVSKRQYYQAAACALKVELPIFDEHQTNTISKVVSGEKAKRVLSYKFVYPNLLTWL